MTRSRWAASVALGVALLALALWPRDEEAHELAPVAEVQTPPPLHSSGGPDAGDVNGAALTEGEPTELESEPGLFVIIEAVRKSPCESPAGTTTCDEPLASFRVAVFGADDGGMIVEGVTDAEGQLPLPMLAPGSYSAQVVEPGWLAEPHDFDFEGAAQIVQVEATKPARLELRVLSPSGLGVRGAQVELSHDVAFISSGETDELGRFRVEQAATGLVELSIRMPGFVPVDERFVLEGDTVKTVTLRQGRAVVVNVVGAPPSPLLMIDLRGDGGVYSGMTLHPPQTSVTLTELPSEPLVLTVTEMTHANQTPLLRRTVGANEREITVEIGGRTLDVFVDGKRPRTAFSRGKCCAPHAVELRCEGRPTRRKAFQGPPGSVSFPLVPDVGCWVSYDGEREVKVVFPETVLRAD